MILEFSQKTQPSRPFLDILPRFDRANTYQLFIECTQQNRCALPSEILQAVMQECQRAGTDCAARILLFIRRYEIEALQFAADVLFSVVMTQRADRSELAVAA
jgi:hypothetical protein